MKNEVDRLLHKFMWTSYFFAVAVIFTIETGIYIEYIAFVPFLAYIFAITRRWRI